jgi:hypothetical protein
MVAAAVEAISAAVAEPILAAAVEDFTALLAADLGALQARVVAEAHFEVALPPISPLLAVLHGSSLRGQAHGW